MSLIRGDSGHDPPPRLLLLGFANGLKYKSEERSDWELEVDGK